MDSNFRSPVLLTGDFNLDKVFWKMLSISYCLYMLWLYYFLSSLFARVLHVYVGRPGRWFHALVLLIYATYSKYAYTFTLSFIATCLYLHEDCHNSTMLILKNAEFHLVSCYRLLCVTLRAIWPCLESRVSPVTVCCLNHPHHQYSTRHIAVNGLTNMSQAGPVHSLHLHETVLPHPATPPSQGD